MTAQRKTLIAKIHIAKKDLALCEDSYRDLLERVTGKDSCSGMTVPQLKKVEQEFKNYGWKPKRKPKRAGTRKLAAGPEQSKVRALWLSLYHLGEIYDPTEAALAKFAKRTVKVDDLSWLDHKKADSLIRALRGWCERVGWKPQSDALKDKLSLITRQCEILNIDDPQDYLADLGFDMDFLTEETLVLHNYEFLDRIIEQLGKRIRSRK